MTRFDAREPRERRKLFVDAITAHRKRGSTYLTVEAEDGSDGDETGESGGGDESGGDGGERPAPWIQFADKTFNLDCTDSELARLKDLVSEYPEFRIDRLETPEGAQGTNVRITARSDANRLADFVERTFRQVYGRDEGYRAWVVEI